MYLLTITMTHTCAPGFDALKSVRMRAQSQLCARTAIKRHAAVSYVRNFARVRFRAKSSLGEISGNALVFLLRERTRVHTRYVYIHTYVYICIYMLYVAHTLWYSSNRMRLSRSEREREVDTRGSRMRKERLHRYSRLSNRNVTSPR